MKTKTFQFVNRLAVLAFVVNYTIGFNACSSDDNSTIDEILSKETTPIDFEFSGYSLFYGTDNVLFDYAGNNLVGSDTNSQTSCTLNLRQGKHKLIWINGLWPTFPLSMDTDEKKKSGVYYDPKTKTITNNYMDGNTGHVIVYCEKNLEVTPYLLPSQKTEYKHITCELNIEVTDNARWLSSQTEPKGRITGIPSVASVSLVGNEYKLNDVMLPSDSIRRYESNYPRWFMLCPTDGLDNIQPIAEIIDKNGNAIPTTSMPKFSLRRGYTTTVRGPLLSGSSSDWTVTMEPYKEY